MPAFITRCTVKQGSNQRRREGASRRVGGMLLLDRPRYVA